MEHPMQEFPKWKYHESGESLIVDDSDAETALGEGWHDLPVEPQDLTHRAVLLQQAAERGIRIDKRWSDARIKLALEPVAPAAETVA